MNRGKLRRRTLTWETADRRQRPSTQNATAGTRALETGTGDPKTESHLSQQPYRSEHMPTLR
ncbi:hypothetical protein BaRGS_00000684, partial [Batillaria attramentaria]